MLRMRLDCYLNQSLRHVIQLSEISPCIDVITIELIYGSSCMTALGNNSSQRPSEGIRYFPVDDDVLNYFAGHVYLRKYEKFKEVCRGLDKIICAVIKLRSFDISAVKTLKGGNTPAG